MVYCNNGWACKDGWAGIVDDQTFGDFYQQSLPECLEFGSCPTTEEEECSGPEWPEGGSYDAANHEACISGQRERASSCEVEDVGGLILPAFPAECELICVVP